MGRYLRKVVVSSAGKSFWIGAWGTCNQIGSFMQIYEGSALNDHIAVGYYKADAIAAFWPSQTHLRLSSAPGLQSEAVQRHPWSPGMYKI